MKKRRWIVLAVVGTLLLQGLAMQASAASPGTEKETASVISSETAAVVSGTYGTQGTWSLDSLGVLTVGGENIPGYQPGEAPWYEAAKDRAVSLKISSGVTSVGNAAFYGLNALEKVELADSITSIGSEAFACCNLKGTVALPAALERVSNDAFSYNKKLTAFSLDESNLNFTFSNGILCDKAMLTIHLIPPGMKKLVIDGRFDDPYIPNSYATSITLGEGITMLKYGGFADCPAVTDIYLPSSFTSLGADGAENLFYGCPNLRAFHVSSENTVFYSDNQGLLFGNSSGGKAQKTLYAVPASLKKVTVDADTLAVARYAFRNSRAYSLDLGGNAVIPYNAFTDMTNLTEVRLSGSVNIVSGGNNAYRPFAGCENLNRFVTSEDCVNYVTDDNGLLYSADGKTLIAVPGNVRYVRVADGVQNIAGEAFQGCTLLERVYFPYSVKTYLASNIFRDCPNLTDIYFRGSEPSDAEASDYYEGYTAGITLHEYCISVPSYFKETSGWRIIDDVWYYYRNGIAQVGWLSEGNNEYYLSPLSEPETGKARGYRYTGFLNFCNKIYYFDPSAGYMVTGWVTDTVYEENTGKTVTKKYYFLSDGTMHTGWLTLEGKTYFFNEYGVMETGWVELNNRWYYMDADGVRQTGWILGHAYYLDDDGVMQTGWILDHTYYMDEDGGTIDGFCKVDGKTYYLDKSAVVTGRVTEGDKIYYMSEKDGSRLPNGWHTIDGNRFYMKEDESVQTDWARIGGKWYYFNNEGVMQTGWLQSGSSWYYLDASGAMQTGWVKSGNSWYYMNGSGVMQTGWVKDGNSWYYMNGSGAMQTGWVKDGGSWYYMNGSGAMQTGWVKDGGSWYYMNGSGVMQTGWVQIGGKWYYLSPSSGAMQTGWVQIEGKWYYMNASGVWQANA